MLYDVAVVGAGILGLAHAYHLARKGRRVVVLERSPQAQGASIRGFGMLWPIGQPAGARYKLAQRSRKHWLEVLADAGLWHERCGSLHLAYADDEAAVIQELVARSELPVQWLDADAVHERARGVHRDGLRGALWSDAEVCVDPREVLAGLPAFLAGRYGVDFRFGTTVLGFSVPQVCTSAGTLTAARLIVCGGDDIRTLYPTALADEGLVAYKLQMMRTEPLDNDWRIGPMLAAGLTLRHCPAFADCPTLPALDARLRAELPEYERYGIHVLVAQNGRGELTLGASHEYGDDISPFDRERIDQLVREYLGRFLDAPPWRIASRWSGLYLKHPAAPWSVLTPDEAVTLVTGVGGAGLTLAFGLAETVTETME